MVGLGEPQPPLCLPPRRTDTADGISHPRAVTGLAPYVLTALTPRPDRLVHLSSGMHLTGDAGLEDLRWSARRWSGTRVCSDGELHDALIGGVHLDRCRGCRR